MTQTFGSSPSKRSPKDKSEKSKFRLSGKKKHVFFFFPVNVTLSPNALGSAEQLSSESKHVNFLVLVWG